MGDKKEVLSITVRISHVDVVEGHLHKAVMIHFEGEADCDNFKGSILPGAVDTQIHQPDMKQTLSARYILSGVDYKNQPCKIFIENEMVTSEEMEAGIIHTKPRIITDSKALSYLETKNLSGIVNTGGNVLKIHIYLKQM